MYKLAHYFTRDTCRAFESRRSLTETPTNVRLGAAWNLETPCMQKEQSAYTAYNGEARRALTPRCKLQTEMRKRVLAFVRAIVKSHAFEYE